MMEILPNLLIGLFMIFIALITDKSIVRIQFRTIGKFVLLMMAVTAVRLLLAPERSGSSLPIQGVFFVWWEDAFFTLPLLLLNHYKVDKRILYSVMAVSAVAFACGHLYLSVPWAATVLIYVPLISFRYGLKCGLGSVMVCHILYDIITTLTYAWS